jgi:hypothetical protein
METCRAIERAASAADNRLELWPRLLNELQAETVAEVGIFRGDFAQRILKQCEAVQKYYMIDPWRHLDDWNKPANKPDDEFARIKEEALAKTAFAAGKRVVLQGRTREVSGDLPDEGLDFAYVDGDHTLRGITIDLVHVWPKMRDGGILGGDDFCPSVWQHEARFEPTLVFPLAVYFAEAVGSVIYGLPFNQFALVVDRAARAFEFRDLTGAYRSTTLRDALAQANGGPVRRVLRALGRLLPRG